MSDKERLEEIKSRVWKEHCTYAVGDDSSREGYRYILSDEDYHWLMEQAEKAEKYREALEFYADENNYEWETNYRPQQEIDCMVIDDGGHTARKALEGENNE